MGPVAAAAVAAVAAVCMHTFTLVWPWSFRQNTCMLTVFCHHSQSFWLLMVMKAHWQHMVHLPADV